MTDTINTRELIMNILLEMDREKTPCHLAVRDALDKYQFLPRQDRAFIKRVCEGTVEYGIQNDYIINQYSKIKINKCKPVIRAILRMSVYQIRFLDAVPDSAVVNEAVKLAEKKHFYNLKGFVNGVLRTIVREKDHLPMPKENNTTQYLSMKYSMPEFLVEEFVSQYGKETAETMMADFLKEKQVTIRINRWNNTIEETKKSLESQGAELEKAPYLGEAFYLKNFETIASLNAFQEGRFQIQAGSSMMAAHLADPKPGDQVLDLCAAPGGKSLHAADKMRNQGCVEARDLTEYKVDLIRENVQSRCFLRRAEGKRCGTARCGMDRKSGRCDCGPAVHRIRRHRQKAGYQILRFKRKRRGAGTDSAGSPCKCRIVRKAGRHTAVQHMYRQQKRKQRECRMVSGTVPV